MEQEIDCQKWKKSETMEIDKRASWKEKGKGGTKEGVPQKCLDHFAVLEEKPYAQKEQRVGVVGKG